MRIAEDAGGGRARWVLLSAVMIALIVAPFLIFGSEFASWSERMFEALARHPWRGGALVVALLAGDVFLPVPSSVVSTFAGASFGWRGGTMLIWLGMMAGSLVGYALGASAGRQLAVRIVGQSELVRARGFLADVGPALLVVTRAVPVVAESAVLAAGAARMPLAPFLLATGSANAAVALAYAGIGHVAAARGQFLLIFLGMALLPAIAWLVWRRYGRTD